MKNARKPKSRPQKLMPAIIGTGDYVKHLPTKERWVVACVEDGMLSWVGHEEGRVPVRECKLLRHASPAQQEKVLKFLASMENQNDHRARYARKVFKHE